MPRGAAPASRISGLVRSVALPPQQSVRARALAEISPTITHSARGQTSGGALAAYAQAARVQYFLAEITSQPQAMDLNPGISD